MSKWVIEPDCAVLGPGLWRIFDQEGETDRLLVSAVDKGVAQQIVREHNAHENLIGLVKKYGATAMVEATNAAFRANCEENAAHWKERARYNCAIVAEIDAVLAEAEGRENGEG